MAAAAAREAAVAAAAAAMDQAAENEGTPIRFDFGGALSCFFNGWVPSCTDMRLQASAQALLPEQGFGGPGRRLSNLLWNKRSLRLTTDGRIDG